MARTHDGGAKKVMNRGAWTAEEDKILSEFIEIHGAMKWKTIAIKSGLMGISLFARLNRCGKSCRLRWLNYLRPNIKRGNISDEEEDLILRLHKLLGNRWSLIAGRIPGRTDNEIKNYWNSHLSKRINQKKKIVHASTIEEITIMPKKSCNIALVNEETVKGSDNSNDNFDMNDLFNFLTEGTYGLEWVNKFLELDEDPR